MTAFDGVLVIGFGGPDGTRGCECSPPCRSDAYCFVKGVLGPDPRKRERLEEVAARYEAMGGTSPYNALTFAQADALEKALRERGLAVPVRAGMRNWTPRLKEALAGLADEGCRRALGVIMSPLQCHESWERYMEDAERAAAALGGRAPAVEYLPFWGGSAGYAEALADILRKVFSNVPEARREAAALVFMAHSIPVPAAERAPYVAQFRGIAEEVAARLKRGYTLAYQSAPLGSGAVPWLAPDINDALRELAAKGVRDAVVAPVGFLCDHMEVIYDLDTAARATAEECGIAFRRAPTVGTHPAFIGMLADEAARMMGGSR
jgi:protoporphyrin/coproporphyrin ferrochelatase